ncbi:ovochymase-2-like [Mantella aurantiaca]
MLQRYDNGGYMHERSSWVSQWSVYAGQEFGEYDGGGYKQESSAEEYDGARCGEQLSINDYRLLSRIVGGTRAKENDYPWIASIKRKKQHICGGTIVSKKHVITAAHCVTDKNLTRQLKVIIGDRDFTVKESSEQVFSINKVIVHPSFLAHQPINYDVAIVVLEGHIVFGAKIQPACLPSPDEFFPTGSLCVALGWGRTSENGPVATSLQQVTLPIVDHQTCIRVLQTLGPSATFETAVCAGFPEGGRDACQGDSGGPFLCRRSHGRFVLVGVTSWGMGCARRWSNNVNEPPDKRGSPGIFTQVQKLLEWLNINLNQELETSNCMYTPCHSEPVLHDDFSERKCTWKINVPEGKHILLTFEYFDLEFDYTCDLDYLAVYFEKGSLVGKFCGGDRPRPLLITRNKVNLKFISDFQEYRTGFALSYQAVDPEAYLDSQCGSVAVISGEGEIQTMNHPEKYSSYADCKWIISCPAHFKIKITFHVFEVELSKGCIFDYVLIYHDLEGINVAGRFCGFSIPDPVESTSNIMQIIFSSDSRGNHIGFRATISFHFDKSIQRNPTDFGRRNRPQRPGNRVVDVDTGCVAAPIQPMFINQSITVAEEAVPNSWPWHISINYGIKHFCSGVIVTKTYVLTTAGCVAQKRLFLDMLLVVAGLHDLERSEDTQKCSVKEINIHPEFVSVTMENDIALLQLKEPLQFNDNVQPVCFSHSYSMVTSSSICVVTGWDLNGEGETCTKLQQLEIPLETDGVCESYYGKITRSMSCAGTVKGQAKHTCRVRIFYTEDNGKGQPGSPLVCPSSDSTAFFIYGIASRGVGCRGNAKPGVYTKVSLFTEWIQSIIQEELTEMSHYWNDTAQGNPQISADNQPHQISNFHEQPVCCQAVEQVCTIHEPRAECNPSEQFSPSSQYPMTARSCSSNEAPAGRWLKHHWQSGTKASLRSSRVLQKEPKPIDLQETGLSNGSSSQSIYTECKGVVLLQRPGEVKLITDTQDRPEGFSCQLEVQAPANHFIMLNIKELKTSHGHNSRAMIYEGSWSNKTLKAQLTEDTVPKTINSTGPALLIQVNTSAINAQLQLLLSFTFHIQN